MIVEFSIRPMRQPSCQYAARGGAETIDRAPENGQPKSMSAAIEGSWDEVMSVIRGCHQAHADGDPRVATTIVVVDDNVNGWPHCLQQAALPVRPPLGRVAHDVRRIPLEIH
jgi:uncharacterized protein YqgV (UPF0045/DUF77 family)